MIDKIPVEFEKKIYWSIDSIDNFHAEQAFKIAQSEFPISNCIAWVTKSTEEGFICKIFLEKLYDYTFNQNIEKFGVFNEIILTKSSTTYVIDENSASKVELTLSQPQVLTLNLNHFQRGLLENYNQKKLRLVVPVNEEPNLHVIECKRVRIENNITFWGLFNACIDQKNYHLFKYKNDDLKKQYLIIDSVEHNSFDEFKVNTNAIITAFGLMTGKLFLGEYYYQTFSEKNTDLVENIYYEKKEESILTDFPLISPDRFSKYMKELGREDLLKKYGRNMTEAEFSKLCEVIKRNETYARCCRLIIEAHQSKQLLLKAGIFSIALETITGIIYEENQERLNPIQDKILANKIKEKLKLCLEGFNDEITKYGKDILNAKIDDINKPTNSKKLSLPFEMYKIKLSKYDEDVLKHRNKFLHGTSPFKEEDLKSKQKELRYIIYHLHKMLNTLMLKYADYSGHIVNYPAWIQFNSNEEVTDHLFKII